MHFKKGKEMGNGKWGMGLGNADEPSLRRITGLGSEPFLASPNLAVRFPPCRRAG